MQNLNLDREAWRRVKLLCGVDEAGRGALAGPVVAAAVVFPPWMNMPYVRDSKKLTPRRREELFDDIVTKALGVGVGFIPAEEIDETNILCAALKAMHYACRRLAFRVEPELVLIDGNQTIPELPWPQEPFPNADSNSLSVAAASVVAKVLRDRYMVQLDDTYPGYEFSRHKGYSTHHHVECLRRLGLSPEHRRSFRPCAECKSTEVHDIEIT
ncbi:ribonuclease HII [candidate division WOR-3 bacterium]|uniref:Ribonuclease HII n=1 Tax=candidate division WOR-3 bacterium TaxID=2052148 RepID=A0A9D5QC83_UNCW3|nr:ribonuclease HII [candidate division WOR-3 bacterium]MBD3363762.1 ribonuclease HII [candidate division WOR-3 bacterium]